MRVYIEYYVSEENSQAAELRVKLCALREVLSTLCGFRVSLGMGCVTDIYQADTIIALGDKPSAGYSPALINICREFPGKICFLFVNSKTEPGLKPQADFIQVCPYERFSDIVDILSTLAVPAARAI